MPSSSKKKRIYWDACLFITYLDGETPAHSMSPEELALHKEHFSIVENLLADAEDAKFDLYSSAVSVLEVAFSSAEALAGKLSDEVADKIDAFWFSGLVTAAEISVLTASVAQKLMRDGISQGWRLKPRDALHLASAQAVEADELHTWNTELFRYTPIIGVKVCAPDALQSRLVNLPKDTEQRRNNYIGIPEENEPGTEPTEG